MSVCTVHLVRHAEHAQFGRTLTGRIEGVGLSEAGNDQARRLAASYRGAEVTAVLTSPVQRAQETAAAIGGVLGLAPEVDGGLDEIDFGQWAGQTFEALTPDREWTAWNSARSLAATPGGETMLAAQARAVAALMRRRAAGGILVAVSHADVIKAVLAYVLGMPLDLLGRLEVLPACRSILILGGDFARVDGLNIPP